VDTSWLFARRAADWGSRVGKYTVGWSWAKPRIASGVAREMRSSALTPSNLPASIRLSL